MPNVLFTQRCVRRCPYCFANKHMSESSPDDILSWENLIHIADLLSVGGEKRFQILGGEPTLHPEFCEMVGYLLERGFEITVFTSGIMSPRKLEAAARAFGAIPREQLSFVCNLNDPSVPGTPSSETEAVYRFLGTFNGQVTPGFNIYRTDFSLEFIFDYILRFGLQRSIRIGLTHPIPGKDNLFISIDEIDMVIRRIFSFIPTFERLQVVPGPDCGFPMCRFHDSELAWLYRHMGNRYDFGCGPVVDIGPDMQLWPCFPLSSFHKRSLFEFNTLNDIYQYYEEIHRAVHIEAGGIYPACDTCSFRTARLCMGGCIAHLLKKFGNEHILRVKEVYI